MQCLKFLSRGWDLTLGLHAYIFACLLSGTELRCAEALLPRTFVSVDLVTVV